MVCAPAATVCSPVRLVSKSRLLVKPGSPELLRLWVRSPPLIESCSVFPTASPVSVAVVPERVAVYAASAGAGASAPPAAATSGTSASVSRALPDMRTSQVVGGSTFPVHRYKTVNRTSFGPQHGEVAQRAADPALEAQAGRLGAFAQGGRRDPVRVAHQLPDHDAAIGADDSCQLAQG